MGTLPALLSAQHEGSGTGTVAWTLLGPNGDPVFEDQSLYGRGDIGPQTLTTAGDYRLRVFGRGDDTGDYAFKLRPSP